MPKLAVGAVVTTEPTHGMVVFGAPFASISSLCFLVVMEGDLLDPDPESPFGGEALLIDDTKVGGVVNIGDTPIARVTLCADAGSFRFFLDGHERIRPEMEDKEFDHDDTVRIVEFTATVVGTR